MNTRSNYPQLFEMPMSKTRKLFNTIVIPSKSYEVIHNKMEFSLFNSSKKEYTKSKTATGQEYEQRIKYTLEQKINETLNKMSKTNTAFNRMKNPPRVMYECAMKTSSISGRADFLIREDFVEKLFNIKVNVKGYDDTLPHDSIKVRYIPVDVKWTEKPFTTRVNGSLVSNERSLPCELQLYCYARAVQEKTGFAPTFGIIFARHTTRAVNVPVVCHFTDKHYQLYRHMKEYFVLKKFKVHMEYDDIEKYIRCNRKHVLSVYRKTGKIPRHSTYLLRVKEESRENIPSSIVRKSSTPKIKLKNPAFIHLVISYGWTRDTFDGEMPVDIVSRISVIFNGHIKTFNIQGNERDKLLQFKQYIESATSLVHWSDTGDKGISTLNKRLDECKILLPKIQRQINLCAHFKRNHVIPHVYTCSLADVASRIPGYTPTKPVIDLKAVFNLIK